MPHTLDDINALFEEVRQEWNAAEEVVKAAEQICGETVIPSVKELRYAGRRIIDSFHEFSNKADLDTAHSYLKDAIFNCHCARHDAIDVSTATVATNLDLVIRTIGYDHILKAYPEFSALKQKLADIQKKIRASRINRADRDQIYAAIHDADLPDLASRYGDFQAAEAIMKSLARKERRGVVAKTAATVLSLLVAAASVGLLAYNSFHKSPPTVAAPASSASPSPTAAPSSSARLSSPLPKT